MRTPSWANTRSNTGSTWVTSSTTTATMTAKRVTGTVTAPNLSNKIMEYIGNGANYKAKYLY